VKILPVGAELLRADRRTDEQADMTKLIVGFHNFANAPNKTKLCAVHKTFSLSI